MRRSAYADYRAQKYLSLIFWDKDKKCDELSNNCICRAEDIMLTMLHPMDQSAHASMKRTAYANYGAGLALATAYDLDLSMTSDPQQTMANLVKLQNFAKAKTKEVGD